LRKSWSVLSAVPQRIVSALCFMLLFLGGDCYAERQALRVSDGKIISFNRMMEEIKGSRVVVVGENHDNVGHHQIQQAVIDAFHQAEKPLAIGLEMFRTGFQPMLDRWVAGTLDEAAFIRVYGENWGLPWPLYSEIFLYARNHKIPLVGLNLEQNIAAKVARQGFASLTPKELAKLPPGITCSVDPVYMSFIKRSFSTHLKDEKSFVRFCEAQKLWNMYMASQVINHLKRHPQQTMVVIAGAGHALKGGMPAEIGHASRLSCKVILPEFSELTRKSVTVDDADYLIIE